MMQFFVTFSCNPENLSPAACSTRLVSVHSWEEIPDACAKARNHTGPVTIVSLHRKA